ncbi:MAG: D-mannonate epimerase, partial [Candidatus Marinimicrobia bacterium]|nr:D-mannonate epimerase [Candidatus Neomarinimicrobiota bacterium]
MLYYAKGSVDTEFTAEELESGLHEALDKIGPRKKVLAIPPDFTRYHSFAGELTNSVWKYYGDHLTD